MAYSYNCICCGDNSNYSIYSMLCKICTFHAMYGGTQKKEILKNMLKQGCIYCGRWISAGRTMCLPCEEAKKYEFQRSLHGLEIEEKKEETSMNKLITIKLPSGATITGTYDQIQSEAKNLNIKLGQDGVHYLSSRLGLITIASMTKEHIKNALLKIARNTYNPSANAYNRLTVLDLAETNITVKALLTEYLKRI